MKKREWVEVGFAWIFDVFREESHTRKGLKNGFCGSKKGLRKENAARNKTQPKTLGRYKRHKTQNLADERRITGRFAKRFSGERPVSLGFELTFLSEFSEFVWRVLDRDAKRRACISQAPAKEPFEVFCSVSLFLI